MSLCKKFTRDELEEIAVALYGDTPTYDEMRERIVAAILAAQQERTVQNIRYGVEAKSSLLHGTLESAQHEADTQNETLRNAGLPEWAIDYEPIMIIRVEVTP